MEEPKSITQQRHSGNYIKDLFTKCSRCNAKFSYGMEIMDPCGGGDDYNIQQPWSFYHAFPHNLCFQCLSKMTPTDIKSIKDQQDRKKAELIAEIQKKNTTYDPCIICKEKSIERHVRHDVKHEVCDLCRAAVLHSRRLIT